MSSDTIKYSIIIPIYNDLSKLEKNLNIWRKVKLVNLCEFILCNNQVYDKNKFNQLITPTSLIIKKVDCYNKKSAYYARNQGVKVSKGSYLLFCDADCFPGKNLIVEYEKFLKLNPNMVIGNISFVESINPIQQVQNKKINDQDLKNGFMGARAGNLLIVRESFPFFDELPSGGDSRLLNQFIEENLKIEYALNAVVYHQSFDNLTLIFQRGIRFGLNHKRGNDVKIFTLLKQISIYTLALFKHFLVKNLFPKKQNQFYKYAIDLYGTIGYLIGKILGEFTLIRRISR